MKLIEKIIELNPDFYNMEQEEVIAEIKQASCFETLVFDTLALIFSATPFHSFRNNNHDYEEQVENFFNQEVD